jgi:hypothetical protein
MLVLANYSIEAEARGGRERKGFRDLTLFSIWKYMGEGERKSEDKCRKQASRN